MMRSMVLLGLLVGVLVASRVTWLTYLSFVYRNNTKIQETLRNHFLVNYLRDTPHPPYPIAEETPVIVLVWRTDGIEHLVQDPDWASNCSVPCRVTADRAEAPNAHVIMTGKQSIPEAFHSMKPWQKKALLLLQPDPASAPFVNTLGPFYMLVSFSRHSDVKIDYSRSLRIPTGMPDMRKKNASLAVAAFYTSCGNAHENAYQRIYLKELGLHIPVDLYSACPRENRTLSAEQVRAIAEKYYFALVIEDPIIDDYITDRFYEALASDAVPVYMGAPNVADYLPNQPEQKMVVEARHYADPSQLAAHLRGLMGGGEGEEAYLQFFAWRASNTSALSRAEDFEGRGGESFVCRMCVKYHDQLQAYEVD